MEVSAEALPKFLPASSALFFFNRTEETLSGAEALAKELDLRLLLSTKSPGPPTPTGSNIQPSMRTPLASDMEAAMSDAWAAPDDELLVLKPGIWVAGRDIKKLRGSEWLNAERSEEKGGAKVFAFTSLYL